MEVSLEHEPGVAWTCPECGKAAPLHDHGSERRWRHLDTCQLKPFLKAMLPRVTCSGCGVRQVGCAWVEPGGRFTLLMERFVIAALTQCETARGAAKLARINWSAAVAVMKRATERGLERRGGMAARRLGVDEKAFEKCHKYSTLIYDLDESAVLYVGDDRTTESLSAYYAGLSEDELAGIEAVAMDMWQPYMQATVACVPGAGGKIVYDRFHIAKHMNGAVDKVRRAEHRTLSAIGFDGLEGTRFDWLAAEENVPESRAGRFEWLRSINFDTSRAWAIRSRLDPVEKVARMIKRHIDNTVAYCDHPVTNAVAEAINSKIMSIRRQLAKFRNKDNFKTAVDFDCGSLKLDPLESA